MRGKWASLCLNYLPKIGSHMWSKQEVALGETKAKCQQSSWLIGNFSIYIFWAVNLPSVLNKEDTQNHDATQHVATMNLSTACTDCSMPFPAPLNLLGNLGSSVVKGAVPSSVFPVCSHCSPSTWPRRLNYSRYSQALTKILSESSLPEGHDRYRTVYNWIVLKQKCQHIKYRADPVVLLKKWETCVNPSWSCKNRIVTVTANLKRADKWRRHSWHSREYHPLALRSVHIPNVMQHHPSVSRPLLWQCEATVPRQEPKEGLYKYVWECQSMGTLNFDRT